MHRTLVVAVLSSIALVPAAAQAHQGNPNYRSVVERVSPRVAGVSLQVVNLDDSLELTNRSKQTVVMEGYDREPYVRIKPDGTVEVNQNSPALYLNEERDTYGEVPAGVSKDAEPRWKEVDKTGRFAWHDHRIHYMGEGRPPAVEGATVRTKAYDWKVPFKVGTTPAVIDGSLFWVPTDEGGGASVLAFAGLGLLALIGAGAAVLVRRRRRDEGGTTEAW